MVRGAAELHPPEQSPDSLPEIAFSVEASVRRQGVGSILFRKLIAEARAKGYTSLRITTGAQNEAMRALASKFGAQLTFRHGESTGTIDLHATGPAGARCHLRCGSTLECRPRDRELQPRLLADGDPDVWLGPRGLKRALTHSAIRIARIAGTLKLALQVPVRLSLPNRLTTRRSTTTERCAPCSPAITRVAERATARPVFFTSVSTSSYGRPISAAAISACCS